MPTKYVCPGCENTIVIPNRASQMIQDWRGEEIGCMNTDDHEDDDPLVMWEEGDE